MSLVDKIKLQKDEEVIAELYKDVMPAIKKYVLNNGGNLDDAHDVFQEGVYTIYTKVFHQKSLDTVNINGYLYQTCVYYWIKTAKKRKNISYLENNQIDEKHKDQNTRFFEQTSSREKIVTLFKKLGDKCSEVLELSILSEISQEDITARMGFTSLGATKMQYKRCKKKLIKLIKEDPFLLENIKN